MNNIILFNKPFQVLSQFSNDGDKKTLAHFIDIPNVYPAGRLDFDSEGLMLLTENGSVQHLISSPTFKMPKTYWAQVEGIPSEYDLEKLRNGVELKDGITLPAQAKSITPNSISDRSPPVRFRQAIPTSWVELKIHEGKNRQVRRMTAAIGYPTLRLIRVAIGPYSIDTENLAEGEWKSVPLSPEFQERVFQFEKNRKKSTSRAPTNNSRRHYSKTQSDGSISTERKTTPNEKTGRKPLSNSKRVARKTTRS
ncbi:pseudouridine synthase [Marinomonas sp. 2405UD68-3]|uniref:pseudouridine synthase n=1 Tax=Marinomonas sp. 2405UD68-3 TaxID=3391835 RepID=UPI0039C98978